MNELGVQQCFGVVYEYHDEYIVEYFSTTTKQGYYILLSDFQIRQNEAWVITNSQRFAPVLKESESCWILENFLVVANSKEIIRP